MKKKKLVAWLLAGVLALSSASPMTSRAAEVDEAATVQEANEAVDGDVSPAGRVGPLEEQGGITVTEGAREVEDANGGISQNHAELTQKLAEGWNTLAVAYEEKEGNGAVTVYVNGKESAQIADIGFKLSGLQNIQAMLGRSFRTSFLMGGIFDSLVVCDAAITPEEIAQEAQERMAARRQQLRRTGQGNGNERRRGPHGCRCMGRAALGYGKGWDTADAAIL